MELRSSQIGTSVDGGLGPQNQVTRKMKPVLLLRCRHSQFNERPVCLGLQAALALILFFHRKNFGVIKKVDSPPPIALILITQP
jgi:hypothetical protein